ncbi:hypothetical protein BU101_09980 [Staphylococcus shinii]|uniref:Uncharacterized protein n=1 Tax=Staphylococcus shinii TaxID=2912228 RepID=A0A418IFQ4_9STAP|nr:hypothetical protein BU112_06995 [Staphylococcus shinii]RIN06951.1 hypothetical protein BU101_09980 [Staphylococcus shinii]
MKHKKHPSKIKFYLNSYKFLYPCPITDSIINAHCRNLSNGSVNIKSQWHYVYKNKFERQSTPEKMRLRQLIMSQPHPNQFIQLITTSVLIILVF